MAAMEEDHVSTNLDYLFEKKERFENKWRSRVRCDECVYSEPAKNMTKEYLHCTYYPYMNCRVDCTCKAGRKK